MNILLTTIKYAHRSHICMTFKVLGLFVVSDHMGSQALLSAVECKGRAVAYMFICTLPKKLKTYSSVNFTRAATIMGPVASLQVYTSPVKYNEK